jgi:hypothetical protein
MESVAMDAEIYLRQIAERFSELGLEAVLIGNAAAALQGAPVTTVDLDFLFRKTPGNMRKIKKLASSLNMVIFSPFYPAADMYRLQRDTDQFQVDFCVRIHGLRSFEALRSRATTVPFGNHTILVADLADVIKSKKAAGRPQDLAIMDILERTYAQKQIRK